MSGKGARAVGPKGAAGRSSFSTLLIIVCFSVGILGGYMLMGSHHKVDNHASTFRTDVSLGARKDLSTGATGQRTWATKRELVTGNAAATGVVSTGASVGKQLPQNVALDHKPPAKGEVNKEMAAAMKKQQSETSEHTATAAANKEKKEREAMIKAQQSEQSEQKAANAAKEKAEEERNAMLKAQQSDKSEQKAKPTDDKALVTKLATEGGNKAEQQAAAAGGDKAAQAAAAGASGGDAAAKAAADAAAKAAADTAAKAAADAAAKAAADAAAKAAADAAAAKAAADAAAKVAADAAAKAAGAAAGGAAGGAAGAAAKKPKQLVFPDANTWPITPVKEKMPGNTIHTLFTSNGSPYQNIQARIMVGTYNAVRKMPGGERLVALTRILHRTTPDEVMEEIPTFIAQPLQPECDKWCWFPVADRANAFQQFVDAAEKDPSLLKAPWLLLLETDYVWVKPLPDPGDAYDRKVPGWSFAFDYIMPNMPIITQLLKDRCPDCDPSTIPNSGPAPVLARFSDFKAATPIWEELSLWIETHEDAKKQLGWVREMYAWDVAVAANRLNIRNEGPPTTPLISQPPHDRARFNASMYHYTWGTLYKLPGVEKEIWIFDKRTHTAYEEQLKLQPLPMPPDWTDQLRLQDGLAITQELHGTVVDMLTHMNDAIKVLPDLTEHVNKLKAEGKLKV